MNFSELLIHYYTNHYRKLPWRETSNPYFIWLSEVILQQTRVAQGLKYYYKFCEYYPTVQDFAAAKEEEVLKLWQGLGYYSRARNMHETAKVIVNNYQGKFPGSFAELKKLKGIGDYTAAAIASFAFHEPVPVVDGNVNRLVSRYYGVTEPIDSTAGRQQIKDIVNAEMDRTNPGIFNQAIMEFGAMVCTPKSPQCEHCLLRAGCYAYNHGSVDKLPLKSPKTISPSRYFYYFIVEYQGSICYRQRSARDIWKGLHDFPMVERKEPDDIEKIMSSDEFHALLPPETPLEICSISDPVKHVLTHRQLHIRFIHIRLKNKLRTEWKWIEKSRFEELAVPVVIENYWKRLIGKD